MLRINSPGAARYRRGRSTTRSGDCARSIRIPLYAVVETLRLRRLLRRRRRRQIYVDKASIVGSIGVLMDGFGFTTMEKLGVERRLLTAGENKGFLDPFSPSTQQEDTPSNARGNPRPVHRGRARRPGKRLKETPEMFCGLVWSGEKASSWTCRRLGQRRICRPRRHQGRKYRRLHPAAKVLPTSRWPFGGVDGRGLGAIRESRVAPAVSDYRPIAARITIGWNSLRSPDSGWTCA